MNIIDINFVIASRELKKNSNDLVTILVGKPEKFPDGQDYFCPYKIVGLLGDKVRYACGVDAIQAIMLALEQIGIDLYTSEEYKNGALRLYEKDGDLGFPLPYNVIDIKREK